MADEAIVAIVQRFLHILRDENVPAQLAVIFGSCARGAGSADSDIDILVVAPEYDVNRWEFDEKMWKLTLRVDPRIEPIPVGLRQLEEDDVSPLLEMARREGFRVEP